MAFGLDLETDPFAGAARDPLALPLQPWHWRSRPLVDRDGRPRSAAQVFEALFLDDPSGIAVLLDSPHPSDRPVDPIVRPLSRYALCAGGPRRFGNVTGGATGGAISGAISGETALWTAAPGGTLPLLRQLERRSRALAAIAGDFAGDSPDGAGADPDLPFRGGWLGWLGYDVAWELERLPAKNRDPLPFPVAFWYEPDCFALLDREGDRLWLAATDPADLDRLEARLDDPPPRSPQSPAIARPPQFLSSQADYEAAVERARSFIRAGDIFQANLTLRFGVETEASSWAIYRTLRAINPSPFACYWQTPWGDVASCSPERLLQVTPLADGGRRAATRPIAGTRPRGTDHASDRQLEAELRANPKERAEHAMLVDLERNDLGRICQWGSVAVDEFATVERYSHVMHLTSNVTGLLRPEADIADWIRAVFPGGTITGCPKVRCMEIIESLEPVRRSLFYGSCGYWDWRGSLDLNILIRTLLLPKPEPGQPAIAWGQVGAGIVADSDPHREWLESLQKAAAQRAALDRAGTEG